MRRNEAHFRVDLGAQGIGCLVSERRMAVSVARNGVDVNVNVLAPACVINVITYDY